MQMPLPDNEPERLAALATYEVLDTGPEGVYDDLTELAAETCACPIAFIGLMDKDREFFKSKWGIPAEVTEAQRDLSVCATTVCMSDMLHIADLSRDERSAELPSVKGEPHFRFYCGMPLINRDGFALGTMVVADFEPRELDFDRRETLRRLARQAVTQLELRRQVREQHELLTKLQATQEALAEESARSTEMLHNILPRAIAEELRNTGHVTPRFHDSATVLFTDFQGFSRFAEQMEPGRLVSILDQYFTAFDEIVSQHGLEKLKTIGDAYMCIGGVPEGDRWHPVDACLAALKMQEFADQQNVERVAAGQAPWGLRIGIHTGSLISGVVGRDKFAFDVWGDAVNLAARMESAGEAGRINVSARTMSLVSEFFDGEPRGEIAVKNKKNQEMHFLTGLRTGFASDAAGRHPNDDFVQRRRPAERSFANLVGDK